MNEEQIQEELDSDPFKPLRLHLLSGKTIDILRPNAAMALRDRLMVFRNLAKDGRFAEGYDLVGYHNIERIELLDIGRPAGGKRKRA